jgi:hypothetical protein
VLGSHTQHQTGVFLHCNCKEHTREKGKGLHASKMSGKPSSPWHRAPARCVAESVPSLRQKTEHHHASAGGCRSLRSVDSLSPCSCRLQGSHPPDQSIPADGNHDRQSPRHPVEPAQGVAGAADPAEAFQRGASAAIAAAACAAADLAWMDTQAVFLECSCFVIVGMFAPKSGVGLPQDQPPLPGPQAWSKVLREPTGRHNARTRTPNIRSNP